MSRWRIAVLLLLLAVPLVFLVGLGSYRLWQLGLGFYVWWPLSASLALGYYLGWYWLRQKQLIRPAEMDVPPHWTDRDRQAWQLVETRAKAVAALELIQLNEIQFYTTIAQEMALELARFYHPEANDPFSSLTVPEILAVIELASHDLTELVDQNVPGGHLMTVRDWRWAKQAAERATTWYRNASNVYWLISAVLSPLDTGLRYAASQVGMARPMQMFQQDLIAWFHTAFVHRLGKYLIDLNSGRLRIGAARYRQLTGAAAADGIQPPRPADEAVQVRQVTLTILGQVKMGKSSFINALLGERRAATDVLPATSEITRYELHSPNIPTRLVLLDTVGYAHAGPKEDQLRATTDAARQADLLVLVLHARNPARQADLEMLQSLRDWFAARPDLKMPPILAVLTHIDLLSPSLEWSPPYDWQQPRRPKEEQMRQALEAVREQFGSYLAAAIPVCAAEGRAYGVEEWFLPALAELLGEARSVALLRCLRAEADAGKMTKVFQQLLTTGERLLHLWLRSGSKGGPTPG